MLYPKNIEEKIGFDKIREILRSQCLSSLGTDYVDKIRFSSDPESIHKWIAQTQEFRNILLQDEPFPTNHFLDGASALSKASAAGSFLTEEEFLRLKLSYGAILNILSFLSKRKEIYPQLNELTQNIEADRRLVSEIDRVIDDSGAVRDNASPELSRIKSRLQQEQAKLRRTLNRSLQKAVEQGLTADDVSLTIRNGRMVIPVNAAYKRAVKGFVHDESSTGQTVYIEPEEALESNNAIRELQYEEKREIARLLIKLTDYLRPSIDQIRQAYRFLAQIDFIRAKAKLALTLECEPAEISPKPVIKWVRASHPLLLLSHKRQGKLVVPLNAALDEHQKILIVSGPNAGGKSVCLKTIALGQYMFQCGIMPSLKESSVVGIFKNLFIDIGDEQSIENDLSTYSSHLKNMKHFLNFSDKETLFLIDEFGAGTDPQIGGAMAEAILEQLHSSGAFGVVTTHYANLKKYADDHPGVVNAAMRFDIEALEPLYELEIGKPGSSFAIEIARKIGLPKQTLNAAKEKAGVEQIKMERLLAQLENEKREYDEKLAALTSGEKKLKQTIEEYESLSRILENNKKQIISEAKAEAQSILRNTNQLVEKTIRDIRESHAEKVATRKAREKLEAYKTEVAGEKVSKSPARYETVGGAIGVGDWVRIKGQSAIGQVVDIKGKDAEVAIGDLKSKIKFSRLEKISNREASKAVKTSSSARGPSGLDISAKMASFSPNLDLRGARAEEALARIDAFIDDALLLGQKDLRIIHGKGAGILRQAIREKLKTYPVVKEAREEHVERGGAGVTLIELK